MKQKVLLLVLILAGIACQAQNQIDKQGRRQGHWLKTDKQGAKVYEGDFVDGLETGTFTYYYPDGTVLQKAICWPRVPSIRRTATACGSFSQRTAIA